MDLHRIRVFLSSPGDVAAERQAAMRVLGKIQDDPFLRDQVAIQAVAWDAPGKGAPLLATVTPQEAINLGMRLPSECDLVTVIIAGRLGTPLPSTMLKPDGSRYRSGTEWEYENALEGFRRQGLPHVVLYRRVGLTPPADDDHESASQRRLVDGFFEQFFETRNPDGSLPGGCNNYTSVDEFEERYEYDVRVMLQVLLKQREHARRRAPSGALASLPTGPPGGRARGPVVVPRLSDLPFVGREHEMEQLRTMFAEHPGGLVTVVGGGGLGKTRLACELAEELVSLYPGGCYFVGLSDQNSLEGVATQLADTLGERLTKKGDPGILIGERLRQREPTLLIVDNFEHLIANAEETVGLWHRAAPQIGWLVTSRAVLGLDDEFCFSLGALSLPELATDKVSPEALAGLASNPAVRLFVERARRRRHDFVLDAESASALVRICREMDGLPLPILLVAGRVNEFTVVELANELGDRFSLAFSSKETLWETIDWSYQLLGPDERDAFLQACIFRDGFSREAFRDVVRLPGDVHSSRARIDRILQLLCDYSLVIAERQGPRTRFRLYRSVQDFGRRMWGRDSYPAKPIEPPNDLAHRWIGYFAVYAERLSARVPTLEAVAALDELVGERENILEAHRWAIEHDMVDEAARLLLAFSVVLSIRGPWQGRVERLIDTWHRLGCGDDHRRARVQVLVRMTEACWAVGDWTQAHDYARQALDLAAPLDGTLDHSDALAALGWIECQLELDSSPLKHLGASLRICRAHGDFHREAISLWILSLYYDSKCHYLWANSVLDKSITLLRAAGDLTQLVRAVNKQGLVMWHSGRHDAALERFEESEQINRHLGDLRWVAGHLTNRGLVLTDLERIDEAMVCFDEAERLHLSQGNRAWWAVNQGGRGYATVLRGDPSGLDLLGEALDLARRVESRGDIAMFLGYIGYGLLSFGRPGDAAASLREAIEVAGGTPIRANRRQWSNLVHLALALSRSDDADPQILPLIAEANRLVSRLGITVNDPVRVVRDCLATLQELGHRFGQIHEGS